MSKHPTYKFEVKGYSSEDVQNIYRYLDLGSQVYINENLEIYDSQRHFLGNITQKAIKEAKLDLLIKYPKYFSAHITSFTYSKSNYLVAHIAVSIKDNYAYFFFKNHPEMEDILFDFHSLIEPDTLIYTNYGPATFLSAYKDENTKYFIVDIPLVGVKSIYDIYSIEI